MKVDLLDVSDGTVFLLNGKKVMVRTKSYPQYNDCSMCFAYKNNELCESLPDCNVVICRYYYQLLEEN